MGHLQHSVAFIILFASIYQAQAGGQRETSDTAKVTLQPWLVGLAAVVGFLFIVFAIAIMHRLFSKKDKDRVEDNERLAYYENMVVMEDIEETKQTNF